MSSALPSYAEAAAMVAAHAARLARHPATERVELGDAAGRVLAASLSADRDQPPFPRSTRDGFACRSAEINTHQPLAVAGSIHAGQLPAGPLPPHAAWEIMTGASVPAGADAVAMLEHVERTGNAPGAIRLLSPRTLEPGENIVPQGAEARAGDEVLSTGTTLGPQHIALAAACGHATVPVFRRPRVAILTTGDELVPVRSTPAPGQIRNSNGVMLASLVARAGGDPWILPTAGDDDRSLDEALHQAVTADMLLISGGVSAGKFDLVEPALARIGARFHFTGVRIQPGKPLVFGEVRVPAEGRGPGAKARANFPTATARLKSCPDTKGSDAEVANREVLPFFGLPGNPISSAATFLLFGSRVLGALAGCLQAGPRFALARLAKHVKGKPDLTRFVPSFCDFNPAGGQDPEVSTVASQGSGDLASFSRSNCFLVVPEGTERLHAGAVVRVLLH